ncbi:TRAP transporter small permease subunit, partial [Eubacteriales bacterium OttesenSCG-928-N13]|nr:TRAP transporter small permease subunit [Eubacteriales bacterium OttesenSCG-928-N13]
MPAIFEKLDRLKPIYDVLDKFVMLICKLLLIADILITSMSVLGRYVPFIPDPAWSEEVVLSLMAYMAVLSAAIALRHGTHIRMTALDKLMHPRLVQALDLLADLAVFAFGIVMIVYGFGFCAGPLARGFYTSIPTLSKFW